MERPTGYHQLRLLVINSYSKWEQAFRVYSNIYMKFHPERGSELIQYSHIIHTAVLTYSWDNVYLYDKEFRLHMARFPERSWAIILHQAWTMRLKDCNSYSSGKNSSNNNAYHGHDNKRGRAHKICRKFNRGCCTYGSSCKFEHQCSYCFKLGHAAVNCRKAIADKERGRDRSSDRSDRSGETRTVYIVEKDKGNKKQ